MKMTTKMIMLQNIEKMVMEQQRVDENDSYIRQDNEDLKYLEERDYKVKEVQCVDMFGHSVHVEVVCCLHRVNS